MNIAERLEVSAELIFSIDVNKVLVITMRSIVPEILTKNTCHKKSAFIYIKLVF